LPVHGPGSPHDPAFGDELRGSLKIKHGDRPLGEQALRTLLRNRRKRWE
jgi:hypothetical protein